MSPRSLYADECYSRESDTASMSMVSYMSTKTVRTPSCLPFSSESSLILQFRNCGTHRTRNPTTRQRSHGRERRARIHRRPRAHAPKHGRIDKLARKMVVHHANARVILGGGMADILLEGASSTAHSYRRSILIGVLVFLRSKTGNIGVLIACMPGAICV